MALGGETTSSMPSLIESGESGESLQVDTRSASGGQRVEITSAIEVEWLVLGVGIANQGRRVDIGSRYALKEETITRDEKRRAEKEVKEKKICTRGRAIWDGVMRARGRRRPFGLRHRYVRQVRLHFTWYSHLV
jgi:hypothetical protein